MNQGCIACLPRRSTLFTAPSMGSATHGRKRPRFLVLRNRLVLRRREAASKDAPEDAVRRLLEHPSGSFAYRKRRMRKLLLRQALDASSAGNAILGRKMIGVLVCGSRAGARSRV